MKEMRLDKFLTWMGTGTRSEVKKILKNGGVTVNGVTVKQPESKVDPERDLVICLGKQLQYQPYIWLMFHKPAGCITATSDRFRKTVMDYIDCDRKEELFPVGRLDIDTEGLLFLTNQGDLAHRMLSPRHHVEKTYFVRTDVPITREDAAAMELGLDIGEEKKTLPAELRILDSEDGCEAELTICEGKYHQVKRMFQARGKQVCYLKRITMAGIRLDEKLDPGKWRYLTDEETERIRMTVC